MSEPPFIWIDLGSGWLNLSNKHQQDEYIAALEIQADQRWSALAVPLTPAAEYWYLRVRPGLDEETCENMVFSRGIIEALSSVAENAEASLGSIERSHVLETLRPWGPEDLWSADPDLFQIGLPVRLVADIKAAIKRVFEGPGAR